MKKYLEFKKYMTEYKDCIICSKKTSHIWAKHNICTTVCCDGCGFIWTNPAPNKNGLDIFYSNYKENEHGKQDKVEKRNIQYKLDREFVLRHMSDNNVKILDIGCSNGLFLEHFSNNSEKHGVEIDQLSCLDAQKKFGSNIFYGHIEDYKQNNKYFDLITMRGIIEHMINPKECISKVYDLLKDDGVLYICATPNVGSFCADMYREKWNQFHPLAHLLYFSDKTLSLYLNNFKFNVVDVHFPYLNTPYADPKNDYGKILGDLELKLSGKWDDVRESGPFWGSMMNIVARKIL